MPWPIAPVISAVAGQPIHIIGVWAVEPVTSESVQTFLTDSEKATAASKEVTRRVRMVTREDDKNYFSETQDREQKDGWIHRNYIRKQ